VDELLVGNGAASIAAIFTFGEPVRSIPGVYILLQQPAPMQRYLFCCMFMLLVVLIMA
jgi:hypothetical protein